MGIREKANSGKREVQGHSEDVDSQALADGNGNELNTKKKPGRPPKPKSRSKGSPMAVRLGTLDEQRLDDLKDRARTQMRTEVERDNARLEKLDVSNSDAIRILLALGALSTDKQLAKAMAMVI
jgi:hypothetical protein